MKTAAYSVGAADALESFGIRVASEMAMRRMPEGPQHLGAEWLAKALSSQEDDYQRNPAGRPRKKMERAVHWGPKTLPGDGRDT